MSEARTDVAAQPRWSSDALALLPGAMLSAIVALAAFAGARITGGPSVLYALLAGLGLSTLLALTRWSAVLSPGLDFSTRFLLRTGVALLGARVTLHELSRLGAPTIVLTVIALLSALLVGLALAKALKIERSQGLILAGATAICGASAALAVAAALPKSRPRDAAAAIAGATVIGAVGMLVYPAIARLLHFDDRTTGTFLGASLHEVAQAVGAGYAVSPVAGDAATAVKLLRVACLGPVVLMIARMNAAKDAKSMLPPWFVLGFAAFALLASFDILPATFVADASAASQWLLLIAIAGLGLKTSPALLLGIGMRPLVMLIAQSLFLVCLVGLALVVMR